MKLSPENYYSDEANKAYFSASQIKTFKKCEAAAMAEINGEYERPASTALIVGGFVDAALTGSDAEMEAFMKVHPEMFKRDGTLKADFVQAEWMIERAKRDPVFMEYMDGDHQSILTGEIGGVPFKAKFDVLADDRIVDLKTVRDLSPVYLPGQGRVTFADAWDWPLQMAIYQELNRQRTGKTLPCYLAVITKEDPPDIEIVEIEQERMMAEVAWLKTVLPRYEAIKDGVIEPERCGHCAFCRATHMIDEIKTLSDFEEVFGNE